MDRVLAHLGKEAGGKKLKRITEITDKHMNGKTEDNPFEQTNGLGPGFLRCHDVTNAWVAANPLWIGLGHGLFEGL